MDRIGAAKAAPDALQKISGLDAKMEKSIIEIGVNSYLQMSKLTAVDIPVMAAMIDTDKKNIDVKWFAQAEELAKRIGGTSIRDKIGIAEGKDDLKKIKGIGASVEDELNKIGVATFKQLAQLTKDDIADLAKEMGRLPHTIKEEWFIEAKTLAGTK